ncbi:CRP/FNR family transcriptional regulator, anaerobic regulatory protein [Virgibacillus subterraneus]|uniref:CRP/FNR family transcriptional regulator, anaerobic regulatory protein n=2 Tax=Virgibacillus TaxID=84406 RepID=A0A1H0YQL6_9BACI|nr:MULTISPECIES: Crp/Fnr family transcriptional regulator [Virgibacillus]SDQ17410.1 CRP/FNR family transcriptional regulator, anaerobic regulatory protein [Virgibacillus salinus]SEP79501.1 CRP/FNR family transcriptional regulator, anaerobic regulatory protein [Virgibacillus subterraneus]
MEILTQTISPWLENLDYDWSPLIDQAKTKELTSNIHIYDQGDQADTVFLVLSGRVRLFMLSSDGREKAISIAGKNCLMGENRVRKDNTYFENAVTASSVSIAYIPYAKFESIIYDNKDLMAQYIDLLNTKLRLATVYNLHLSYGSSIKRICDAFYHLAMNYGNKKDDGITIRIQFTHQELANLIGTSRVTVANTVNNLLKQQILVKKGKFYHIPKLSRLINTTN